MRLHNVKYTFSAKFGQLSWDEIHDICSKGYEQRFFSVGDVKNQSGVDYVLIGFDLDNAPLTIWVRSTIGGEVSIDFASTDTIIKRVDNQVYSKLPADLKKYIKKTTKVCADYLENKTIDFYVFALSGYEMGAGSYDNDNDEWPYTGIKYPFFTSNSSRIVGDGVKWSTREPKGYLSGTEPYSCLIINEGGVLQGEPQTSHDPIYAVGAFAFE